MGVRSMAQRERASLARSGAVIGVSMKPGPMALTRMPCGASSAARHLVSIHTPALLTLYAPPDEGIFDMIEPRLMMLPRRLLATIHRAAARFEYSTPKRLTSTTARKSAVGIVSTECG